MVGALHEFRSEAPRKRLRKFETGDVMVVSLIRRTFVDLCRAARRGGEILEINVV